MATTWNYNSDTFGPVHNWLMGPIADRPATAELNTVYLSTDEGGGVLKMYWYDGSAWNQCNGIEGFTDSGGSSVTVESLSVTANGTYTAPSGTAYSPVTVSVPSVFSTAEVELLGSSPLPIVSPAVVEVSGGATGIGTVSNPTSGETITVPLYNGTAVITVSSAWPSINVFDNITKDDDARVLVVTGDGAISYSSPE